MGEIVDLHGQPASLKDNHEFVVDLARFAEALTDEAAIRKKYRLGDDVWKKLGEDDELVRAITDEKTRRIRNGSHKREKAQGLIVKAPAILDQIMSDVSASPRHRVDAIKQLDAFTGNPQENAPAADRFVITINLGADHIERFDKSISINADDVAPINGSAAAQGSLPIANKWDDGDVVAPVVKTIDPKTNGTSVRRAEKPIKTGVKTPIEHESDRAVERKTPEQIALESMMRY